MFTTYEIAAATDVGVVRQESPNQDHVGVVQPNWFRRQPSLIIVADGMGGHTGGELASKTVIEGFKTNYRKSISGSSPGETLEKCVQQAHENIRGISQKNPQLSGMGSTVVAAILANQNLHLINVGDSRLYLFRGKDIQQLSYDQSVVADMVRKGELTEEDAYQHPKQNQLTMSISARRVSVTPYSAGYTLEPEDVILLCSDGLWGTVPKNLMRAIACQLKPKPAVRKLIELANRFGGPDNISVVIARRKGSPLESVEDEV